MTEPLRGNTSKAQNFESVSTKPRWIATAKPPSDEPDAYQGARLDLWEPGRITSRSTQPEPLRNYLNTAKQP